MDTGSFVGILFIVALIAYLVALIAYLIWAAIYPTR